MGRLTRSGASLNDVSSWWGLSRRESQATRVRTEPSPIHDDNQMGKEADVLADMEDGSGLAMPGHISIPDDLMVKPDGHNCFYLPFTIIQKVNQFPQEELFKKCYQIFASGDCSFPFPIHSSFKHIQ